MSVDTRGIDTLESLSAEQVARWEDLLAYVTDPRAPRPGARNDTPGLLSYLLERAGVAEDRVLGRRSQPPQPPAARRLRPALPRRARPRALRLRHRQAAQGALPARAADARRGLAPRLLPLVLLARRDHAPGQRRPARGVLDRLGHRAQAPGGRVPRPPRRRRRASRRARRRAPRPADDRRPAALRRRRGARARLPEGDRGGRSGRRPAHPQPRRDRGRPRPGPRRRAAAPRRGAARAPGAAPRPAAGAVADARIRATARRSRPCCAARASSSSTPWSDGGARAAAASSQSSPPPPSPPIPACCSRSTCATARTGAPTGPAGRPSGTRLLEAAGTEGVALMHYHAGPLKSYRLTPRIDAFLKERLLRGRVQLVSAGGDSDTQASAATVYESVLLGANGGAMTHAAAIPLVPALVDGLTAPEGLSRRAGDELVGGRRWPRASRPSSRSSPCCTPVAAGSTASSTFSRAWASTTSRRRRATPWRSP